MSDRFDIHFHIHSDPLRIVLEPPSADLTTINHKLDTIMATLADVQAAVTAEDTVIDSAVALLNGLAAQIAALKPNQEAIDALAADVKAKTDSLAQAVAANTTAA
jgi:ABC-type transporter Mla subunit MlaD